MVKIVYNLERDYWVATKIWGEVWHGCGVRDVKVFGKTKEHACKCMGTLLNCLRKHDEAIYGAVF